jgi:hypothetical protein
MRLDEDFKLRRADIYSNPANGSDVLQHVYGDLTDGEKGAVPCVCIQKWNGSTQVFLVADHPIYVAEPEFEGELVDVFVYLNAELLPEEDEDWVFENVDFEGQGVVAIVTFFVEVQGLVSVDCYGKMNGAGELIENLAEICYDLMINVHGVGLEEWHGPKYIEAYQNCINYGYLGGGVVYHDWDPVQLVNDILHPIGAASVGTDKKLRLFIESFDPDSYIADEIFEDQEIEEFEVHTSLDRLFNSITMQYRCNWRKARYSQRERDLIYDASLEDGNAQSQLESKVRHKIISVNWIRYEESASHVMATVLDIWSTPRWTIRLMTTGFKAATLQVGGLVAFTRRTFPGVGQQAMRIQEIKTQWQRGRIELIGFHLDRLIGSPIVSENQTVLIDVDSFIKPAGTGGETHFVPTFDERGRPFTPIAVILSSVMSTASGISETGAIHAIGFSDGTNHGSCAISVPDDNDIAPSTTVAYQRVAPKALTFIDTNADTLAECTLAIVTNGFEVTWTTNNQANYVINYTAFGGVGLTAAKVVAWKNVTGHVEVSDVGFRPDMMFTVGSGITEGSGTPPLSTLRGHLMFSVAPRNGVPFAYGVSELESQSYPITRRALAVGYIDVLPGFDGNAGFFGGNSFGTMPSRAWTLGSLERFTATGFIASFPMHQAGSFREFRYSLCFEGGKWQTIVAPTPHDGSTGVPNSDQVEQTIDALDMVSPRGVIAVAHAGAVARDLVHGSVPSNVMMLGASNFARVWCEAHTAQIYRPQAVTTPINEGGSPESQLSWPLRTSRFTMEDEFIRIPPSGYLMRAGEETLLPPHSNEAGSNILVYTSGVVPVPNRGEVIIRRRRFRERRTLKLPWVSLSNPVSGVFVEIEDDHEQMGVNDTTSHRVPVAYLIVGED